MRIGCGLLLFLLVGCSGVQPATSLDDLGGFWDLTSMTTNGDTFEPGSDYSIRVHIDRGDGSLTLYHDCGSHQQTIEVGDRGAVSISSGGWGSFPSCVLPVAVTPEGSEPASNERLEAIEASNAAPSLLQTMDHAKVDDTTLVLTGPNGAEMRFTR